MCFSTGLAAMGWHASRYEADLIDIQGLGQFLGQAQVAEMDGIERAAQDADGARWRKG
jgi:hypothetical protein